MKHVTKISIDFLHDGDYDAKKLLKLINYALREQGLEPLGDDLESMDHAYPELLGSYISKNEEVIEFTTYPDMFSDYEHNIENQNYDNELKVFGVPTAWAVNWIITEGEMTFDEFMNEYTWDNTLAMYDQAVVDDVMLYERTESR